MNFSIIAELQDQGIHFDGHGNDYIKVHCPYHRDETPSASINLESGMLKCFACDKVGDFQSYLAALHGKPVSAIRKYLEKKYGIQQDKTIPVELIEVYHKEVFNHKHLVGELRRRCISDDTIRLARLGVDNGVITIPVYNANGYVVNVRKYRPGAAKNKFANTKGHGSPIRLYPIDQLKFDKIALCGGEIKALAAAQVLNQHGIGAISTTGGESSWPAKLSEAFLDKTVYVLYDVDDKGRRGAEKACAHLHAFVTEIRIVTLPIDTDKHPKGDVNDFLAEGGDLYKLLELADNEKPYTLTITYVDDDDSESPVSISLNDAVHASNTAKRIQTKCVISAIADRPYSVPKTVRVTCDKDQGFCSGCGVFASELTDEHRISPENPGVLQLVETGLKGMHEGIKSSLGIPAMCRVCQFQTTSYHHIEDIRVSPQLEISDRTVQRELVAAYCVDSELVLNETYNFTGRMHPHPQSQASTLLISKAETAQDALSLYKHESPEELSIFQPDEWTVDGIHNKLNHIYTDFEANVTHIFQRRSMHLAIDLCYHSVLWFDFRKDRIKGWTDILVMGDSAQGKSECIQKLMEHYGLGEKVDCKNATAAGLLGGLAQIGKKWFVSWGVIPTHDKRLVILEEMKGLSVEAIAKLTSMRSLGIAEIPKIEKRKTHARTRLLALSNPRSDKTLSSYNFGVAAIRELVGNPEDVRRFDLALILCADDISPAAINRLQLQTLNEPHVYAGVLCKRLILWAWTTESVVFEDEEHMITTSIDLCHRYSESIPLVDAGSMRFKLARLSIALAARTYSHKNHETVYVRKCHVDYIAKFLVETYDAPAFGYNDFSHGHKEHESIEHIDVVCDIINRTPYPETLAKNLLRKSGFDAQDVADWTALDRDAVQALISDLCREHAIARAGKQYFAAASFILLLKEMVANEAFTAKPEFMNDEDF